MSNNENTQMEFVALIWQDSRTGRGHEVRKWFYAKPNEAWWKAREIANELNKTTAGASLMDVKSRKWWNENVF